MSDDNILQDLNPAQRDAVIHRNGPMLVVAGADVIPTKGPADRRLVERAAALGALLGEGQDVTDVLSEIGKGVEDEITYAEFEALMMGKE